MVYGESKIDKNTVEWIEAHATGTLVRCPLPAGCVSISIMRASHETRVFLQVGDKQEVTAIDNAFKGRRSPLLIGSVKSNMGHAEAAAGVSSLSKVIIAMETGFIPPNINLDNLRTDIEAFKSGRMKVSLRKGSIEVVRSRGFSLF